MSRTANQKNNSQIIAVDIGNSRIKIFDGKNLSAFDYSVDWIEIVRPALENLSGSNFIFGISSVNPKAEKQFLKVLDDQKSTYVLIENLLPLQNDINIDNISGIGADRVLGMIGALDICYTPFITIDCGTAVTLNVVNKRSECIGGVIFPGFDLQSRALGEFTSGLRKTDIYSAEKLIGSNTEEAIIAGINSSVIGGIEFLVKKIKDKYFGGIVPKIIITGGRANLLSGLNFKYTVEQTLVLRGIIRFINSLSEKELTNSFTK